MDNNQVKKIYVCPFCNANLNTQEGFDEQKQSWTCLYCGNTIQLKEKELKRQSDLSASDLFKKAKPIVEFGAGLALIALGTAISAAEYVIQKSEERKATDKENEVKVDPSIEDHDHNII